jgi:hypothetical protein
MDKYDGGVSFLGLLFLLFLGLKLGHVIDWSWWWIFSPLWIPLVTGLLIGLIVIIFYNHSKRKIMRMFRR